MYRFPAFSSTSELYPSTTKSHFHAMFAISSYKICPKCTRPFWISQASAWCNLATNWRETYSAWVNCFLYCDSANSKKPWSELVYCVTKRIESSYFRHGSLNKISQHTSHGSSYLIIKSFLKLFSRTFPTYSRIQLKSKTLWTIAALILLYGCTTLILTKRQRKSQMGTIPEFCVLLWSNPGKSTLQKLYNH